MKKMMYLLFVFSLLPAVVVSADDFIDNRLQVNNSRLETEQEKTLGGQLDATESLFNEKDQKKLADEKRKQEKKAIAIPFTVWYTVEKPRGEAM